MALPALLSGLGRQLAVQGAKSAAKGTAKKMLGGRRQEKNSNAIVKQQEKDGVGYKKSSALVPAIKPINFGAPPPSPEVSSSTKGDDGSLLTIKEKVIKIENLLGEQYKNRKKQAEKKRKLSERAERSQREEGLEQVDKKTKKVKGLSIPIPGKGLFDRLISGLFNFIFWVGLGKIFPQLQKMLPTLISIGKVLASIGNFIIDALGTVLNIVVNVIDTGYKIYDKVKEFAGNIGGDGLVKAIEDFSNVAGKVLNLLLILSMAQGISGGFGRDRRRGGPDVDGRRRTPKITTSGGRAVRKRDKVKDFFRRPFGGDSPRVTGVDKKKGPLQKVKDKFKRKPKITGDTPGKRRGGKRRGGKRGLLGGLAGCSCALPVVDGLLDAIPDRKKPPKLGAPGGKKPGFLSGVIEKVKQPFKKPPKITGDVVKKPGLFGRLKDGIGGALEGAKKKIMGIPSWAQSGFDSLSKFGKKQWGKVKRASNRLTNFSIGAFTELSGKAKQFFLTKVMEPLKPILEPLKKKFEGVGKKLLDGLKKIPGYEKVGKLLKEKGITDISKAGSKLGKRAGALIPIIGGLVNLAFAYDRAAEGDSVGALIEGVSGILDLTGVGTVASMGLDTYMFARDFIPALQDGENKIIKTLGLGGVQSSIDEVLGKLPNLGEIVNIVLGNKKAPEEGKRPTESSTTDSKTKIEPLSQDPSPSPVSAGGAFGESSLISALDSAGYTNKNERAMFLAQMAHESGNFGYDEEIWGPTAAQKGYEGRSDLGNNQPGDGYKYRGRGYIQLTGRANYKQYGKILGVDLENNPDLAKDPNIAARIALEYWKKRVDRKAAQNGDVKKVTYNINGGYNGLSDRQSKYESYIKKIQSGNLISPTPQQEPPKKTPTPTSTSDTDSSSNERGEGSKLAGELGRFIKTKLKSPENFSQVHRHPEHPPWGKESGHSANSLHYESQGARALDIGAWTYEQQPILDVISQFNKKKGVNPVELLHGKNEPNYHHNHVHVAYEGGGLIRPRGSMSLPNSFASYNSPKPKTKVIVVKQPVPVPSGSNVSPSISKSTGGFVEMSALNNKKHTNALSRS
jgi:predicted chitinase